MSRSAAFYQGVYQRDLAAEAEWLRLGAQTKVSAIEQLTFVLPKPFATFCELGCGTGAILEEAMLRGLGCRYYGVDSSLEALEWIRRRHGEKVILFQHDLEMGAPQLGLFFDLVVLSHVLEHLADPRALLAGLKGQCKYLIAEVPLEDQPLPRAKAWVKSNLLAKVREENLAGHVHFFSRSSFRNLLTASGWKILGEYSYLPHQKKAIAFAARRSGAPLWRGLTPYFISKLLGPRVASSFLCVHLAVLATIY